MLTHSFEDLAQTYRILAESYLKMKPLIMIDRAEAVGTIETAANAMLNAFHNLYDLMSHSLNKPINWYAVPELCTILAIRNARHHNKANRIRSIYNYHNQTAKSPTDKCKYFYVDFPASRKEKGGDFLDFPISWEDLDLFLSLPKSESRLPTSAKELVRQYINADSFELNALKYGLKKSNIFINFAPFSLNAGIVLYPYIHKHIKPDSTEAKYFLKHFQTTGAGLTKEHEFKIISFSLPM